MAAAPAHRLPRPQHHRAALRPRPGAAAGRAHRLLHPPLGDGADDPEGGRDQGREDGPRSASWRRPTSSSTSTRTAGRTPRRSPSSSPTSSSPIRSAPRDNLDALPADRRGVRARARRRSGSASEFEARVRASDRERAAPERDVLYLIWRDPWMTIARETYISQTLALFNWRTRPVVLGSPEGDQGQRPLSGGRPGRLRRRGRPRPAQLRAVPLQGAARRGGRGARAAGARCR